MGTCTYTDPRSLRNIERLLASIMDSPKTRQELAVAICMAPSSVAHYLNYLQKEPRRVRITSYQRGLGNIVPVYGVGSGHNARRLKEVPRPIQRKKYLARIKADPDRLDQHRSKKAVLNKIERARKTPATWLTALL